MTNAPDGFKRFHEKIVLGKTQENRIDSAWGTLVPKLIEHYGLADGQVFLQGSYPNGTAIKPDPEKEGGEYDVDLVCVSASSSATPDEALKELESALKEMGYGDQFDRNATRPCVRLHYAEDPSGAGFHVDVIPARASSPAPLEVPLPALGEWHGTDPARYTQWCQDRGEAFARTVQMLKRWRDHHQSARAAIKSIVLQVTVANSLDASSAQDGDRIAGTLHNMNELLGGSAAPPRIPNPVLPSENLAERWSQSEYDNFKKCLDAAVVLADEALGASSQSLSHQKWRELLGKDFPPAAGGGDKLPPPPGPMPGARKAPQEAPQRNEWAQ